MTDEIIVLMIMKKGKKTQNIKIFTSKKKKKDIEWRGKGQKIKIQINRREFLMRDQCRIS